MALLAVLPCFGTLLLLAFSYADGSLAVDFHNHIADAGRAVLSGKSPFPALDDPAIAAGAAYAYPPFAAFVISPVSLLPQPVGDWVFPLVLAAALVGALRIVGVRDWRVYGAAFLWAPVFSAIQTGNLTLLLALGTAVAWRLRDRPHAGAVAVGATAAGKLILWPLVVWALATRGVARAVLAASVAGGLLLASWAAIGFAGLGGYPALLDVMDRTFGPNSFTVCGLVVQAGGDTTTGRVATLLLGALLLIGVVISGRRGDERSSFTLAIAAALALSPIVWLHYAALLVVPLAIARPRFSAAWLVPLPLWFVPADSLARSPWLTMLVLAACTIVVTLCLVPGRTLERGRGDRLSRTPATAPARAA